MPQEKTTLVDKVKHVFGVETATEKAAGMANKVTHKSEQTSEQARAVEQESADTAKKMAERTTEAEAVALEATEAKKMAEEAAAATEKASEASNKVKSMQKDTSDKLKAMASGKPEKHAEQP
ncbi:hypothetical protein FOA52_000342 [Chlamydomonas sp. UWO 241]|nr:hypothetical protein FOA52_000342 [Chlamydomonas sp. UWO 241]